MKAGYSILRAVIPVLLVSLLPACEAITGCKKDSRVFELVYSDPFYDVELGIMSDYEKKGWDCKYDGDIRNAFGRSIGSRYVCTGCA